MRARRKPLRVKHAPPAPTQLRPPLLPSVPAPSVQVAVAVAAAAAAGSSTDSPGRKEAGERVRERGLEGHQPAWQTGKEAGMKGGQVMAARTVRHFMTACVTGAYWQTEKTAPGLGLVCQELGMHCV